MDETDIEALTEHLRSMGSGEAEILQILERVRKYDEQTVHQSVFDSIASGSFNLDAFISEVRAENSAKDNEDASEP